LRRGVYTPLVLVGGAKSPFIPLPFPHVTFSFPILPILFPRQPFSFSFFISLLSLLLWMWSALAFQFELVAFGKASAADDADEILLS